MLTIQALYEALQDMDAAGLLDGISEVVVAYQPHYPLAADATGLGWIDRGGRIELVIGCGDGGNYADSLQTLAFSAEGGELVHEPEETEEEWQQLDAAGRG
jgi:hypothetical protein